VSDVSEERRPLRPAVGRYRPKSNRWWYKLTAVSFTIKVVLVIALGLTLKMAADAARAENEASSRDVPAAAQPPHAQPTSR